MTVRRVVTVFAIAILVTGAATGIRAVMTGDRPIVAVLLVAALLALGGASAYQRISGPTPAPRSPTAITHPVMTPWHGQWVTVEVKVRSARRATRRGASAVQSGRLRRLPDGRTLLEGRTFDNLYDREGTVFEDYVLHRCRFEGGGLWTKDIDRRSVVRRVDVIDCAVIGSGISGAMFEEVTIGGLRVEGDLLQIWGAVFKHVTLRGKVGRVMISDVVDIMHSDGPVQRAFDEANAEYYRSVDWALDISQVEAEELDLRGVPGRLVRRDPATQILVTRERAMAGTWRNLDLGRSGFDLGIQRMLDDRKPDLVLVAARRHHDFRKDLGAIELLRAAGVAEPD